jgi:hypothetical protein
MIKLIILAILFTFGTNFTFSEVCGTKYSDSIPSPSNLVTKTNYIQTSDAISIPIVVHIIYNNSTQNISDSQIQSQINVLNEDFRKMVNTRGFNANIVGADTKVEFRLANNDPSGNLNPKPAITSVQQTDYHKISVN